MVIEPTPKKKTLLFPLTLSLEGEGIVRCLLLPPLPILWYRNAFCAKHLWWWVWDISCIFCQYLLLWI